MTTISTTKAKAQPYRYIPRGALVPIDRTVRMDYHRRGTLRLKKSAFIALNAQK
jgi:hypothetical protein